MAVDDAAPDVLRESLLDVRDRVLGLEAQLDEVFARLAALEQREARPSLLRRVRTRLSGGAASHGSTTRQQ